MELPRLEPIWEKYKDRGVSIVAVEARRQREKSMDFIKEEKLTYHFLEAVEGENDVVGGLYKVKAFPTLFVLDGKNRIMFFHLGFEPGDETKMEKEIELLLNAG